MEVEHNKKLMTSQKINYTITGKTDGFGAQLNAIYSAIAFCEHHPDYNYVHTPLRKVSHGWTSTKNVEQLNEFIGIPCGDPCLPIHTKGSFGNKNVFNDRRPSNWYDERTLKKLRDWYWSTPKPPPCEQDILIHIRRGDINTPENLAANPIRNPASRDARRRYVSNEYYREKIPKVVSMYPNNYTIGIHSETYVGCKNDPMDEFVSIMDGWPKSLKDKVTWKIAEEWKADQKYNLKYLFNDMVTAKVFVQSKSSISYVAGILNENEVWYLSTNPNRGQRYPLDHWRLLEWWRSKVEDGTRYADFVKSLESK